MGVVFISISRLLAALWATPSSSLKAVLIVLTFWVFQNIEIINKIVRGTLFHLISLSLLLTIVRFFITGKTITFYILFELRLIPTLFMVFFFWVSAGKNPSLDVSFDIHCPIVTATAPTVH